MPYLTARYASGTDKTKVQSIIKETIMDKSAHTELHRTFLIEQLPEPLTRASSHIQIFDNYIVNTRMRMRSIRNTETRDWTHILQQRIRESETVSVQISEIYLNADEHERFKIFEGNEIRKNRYFQQIRGNVISFDVYLGNLWGLNTAQIEFKDETTRLKFEPPPFAVQEVTNEAFFLGENLVYRSFADVQTEVTRMMDLPSGI